MSPFFTPDDGASSCVNTVALPSLEVSLTTSHALGELTPSHRYSLLASLESIQRSPSFKSLAVLLAGALSCIKVLFFLSTVADRLLIAVVLADVSSAMAVVFVLMSAVFPFTVAVKLFIAEVLADVSVAIAEALVLMLAVFVFTVAVKLLIAEVLADCSSAIAVALVAIAA